MESNKARHIVVPFFGVLLFCTLGVAHPVQARTTTTPWIVRFTNTTHGSARQLLADVNALPSAPHVVRIRALHSVTLEGAFQITVEGTLRAPDLRRQDRTIAYVEQDAPMRAFFTPNDTSFADQWHWSTVGAQTAWDYDTTAPNYGGDPSVTVAVLDTGVAYENSGSFGKAPDFAQTTFAAGYDFIHNDTHPNDDNGHGTHVASTIAESTNNGTAGAGLAFNTTIMPVKVLDADGVGTTSDVAKGIDFAVQNGAKIINLSLGSSATSQTLATSVTNALNAGLVIVAAAGNDGLNAISYPAAYAGVIAVTATGRNDSFASYANWGTGVTLSAPGGDANDYIWQETYSHVDDNNVPLDFTTFAMVGYQGTSQATPQVSAAFALLLARGASVSAATSLLESTATDLGTAGYDTKFGYGRINVGTALATFVNDTTAPTTTVTASPATPNGLLGYYIATPTITLSASDGDGGSGVHAITYALDTGANTTYTQPFIIPDGTHTLHVFSSDNAGNVEATQFSNFLVNSSGPSITVSSLLVPTTRSSIALAGKVMDSITTVTVLTINGVAVVPAADGTFLQALPLALGINHITITATDATGAVTTLQKQITRRAPAHIVIGMEGSGSQIVVLTSAGKTQKTIFPFGKTERGGISVASGDMTNDGRDEIVVARTGKSAPTIKLYATSGKLLGQFSAFASTMTGGVQVAIGDVDGDGTNEIVAVPSAGGGPQVRIFTTRGKLLGQFFAYASTYHKGVHLAVGDVNGDGKDEIVVAPQSSVLPIRVFSSQGRELAHFSPFGAKYTGSVEVATGDTSGDGTEEILAAHGSGFSPLVRVFSMKGKLLSQFNAFTKTFTGGVHLAAGDISGDGKAEIIVSAGPGGGPQVRIFDARTKLVRQFYALQKSFTGGIIVAAAFLR